ncbi:hypothetical protein AG1IA_06463 [Rhizoctonia solani AG-1 IA]|uniref:Uncharacterized protein n=1 Tax=Thanatephorus cucumeris (strain AG1-IA) TaxID=983506 RepID=L8WRT6_THACA|nr:hypothetical protein AG1IA_06463 [Rhizoctonia solani AG-1 IA]
MRWEKGYIERGVQGKRDSKKVCERDMVMSVYACVAREREREREIGEKDRKMS